MTTVAYSNGVIAGDSYVSFEGNFIGTTKKICKVGDDWLFGACGNSASVEEFFKRKFEFETFDEDFEGIAIYRKNLNNVFVYTKAGNCQINISDLGCYTLGSGSDYAMGAMLAGKSPEESVRIAARVNRGATGSEIHVEMF